MYCRSATRAAIGAQGWLHSGDAGRRDGEGCYFIVDHIKDMYIAYKVPKHVTVVEDYPRTAAGTVQKHLLRQSLRSAK